jgi:hypothetical protein
VEHGVLLGAARCWSLVVIGPWTPQGRAEVLDLEGPGPPRGGCRGSPVTHWGVVDGMGQIYPNNTTFRGMPGPPARGGPGVAFWPAGRLGARDLVGPARGAGVSAGRAGVWGAGG